MANEPFAQDTELSLLLAGVNESARSARTTVSTLLIVAIYLGAVILGTTHMNMLQLDGVVLPQVGLKVPLVTSFTLGPAVFLYLHLLVLIQLNVLERRLLLFDSVSHEADASFPRELIVPFTNLQIRGGPDRVVGSVAGSIAQISVIYLPLVLLFVTCIKYLPVQDRYTTAFQILIMAIDTSAIIYFRILAQNKWWQQEPRKSQLDLRSGLMIAVPSVTIMLPLVFLLLFAHRPPVYDWNLPKSGEPKPILRPDRFDTDQTTVQKPKGLHDPETGAVILSKLTWNPLDWLCEQSAGVQLGCRYLKPQRLVLVEASVPPGVRVSLADRTDAQRIIASVSDGLSIRYRSLRYAHLFRKNMHRIDLTGSDLFGATFHESDLSAAVLRDANLRNAWLENADFHDAEFAEADLRRARLNWSEGNGANFSGADLRGAEFKFSTAQGAIFDGARLSGVAFALSNHRGASYRETLMEGTRFDGADLTGANLASAQAQGAHFWRTTLNGTSLTGASLLGARLTGASLKYADLSFADLRLAYLYDANVDGASFWQTRMQGAELRFASFDGTDLRAARLGPYGTKSEDLRQYERQILERRINDAEVMNYLMRRREFNVTSSGVLHERNLSALPAQRFEEGDAGSDPAKFLLLQSWSSTDPLAPSGISPNHEQSPERLTAVSSMLADGLVNHACEDPAAASMIVNRIINHLGLVQGQRIAVILDVVYAAPALRIIEHMKNDFEDCPGLRAANREFLGILATTEARVRSLVDAKTDAFRGGAYAEDGGYRARPELLPSSDIGLFQSDEGRTVRAMPSLGREPLRGADALCELGVKDLSVVLGAYVRASRTIDNVIDGPHGHVDFLDRLSDVGAFQNDAIGESLISAPFAAQNRRKCELVCIRSSGGESFNAVFLPEGGWGDQGQTAEIAIGDESAHCRIFQSWRENLSRRAVLRRTK